MTRGRDGTGLGLSLCKSLVEVKSELTAKLVKEANSGLRGILGIYPYRQYTEATISR